MSTTWLENYSFPRIFKGRRERTGPDRGVGLYQPAPAVVSAFSYVAVENPNPGAGILTGFPFEGRRTSAHFKTEFPYLLGSTNPCPTAICTRGRSTRDHSQGFVTDPHACLLARASFLPWRWTDSDFHGHRPAV
ncbi:hypothetical protein M430DRAFT_70473 [Amorphotheca resinae ATCC 22711]|uniref:Uncharacterized protein n=1 Tax=Amorphotheca resinae ATCC 22711 TaxID=857342 RepID=A0A2T3ANX3_AMORE|nr:hypothetical protein M430DRAFT_70473 [Amorphotheca resinae ATCC 22711]PSS06607.1 hypothetical protein M430DRAFT_70473 [Amorphotheca resinae ATCC 22711]